MYFGISCSFIWLFLIFLISQMIVPKTERQKNISLSQEITGKNFHMGTISHIVILSTTHGHPKLFPQFRIVISCPSAWDVFPFNMYRTPLNHFQVVGGHVLSLKRACRTIILRYISSQNHFLCLYLYLLCVSHQNTKVVCIIFTSVFTCSISVQ